MVLPILDLTDTSMRICRQALGCKYSKRWGERVGKTPLVSVILLTLNSEKYIARALRSVYSQDYENIEVLVIDAGSSDSTKDIVTSFSGARWLVLPNSDMGMARNFGVRESVGDVIMFLDSDDAIWRKDRSSSRRY